MKNITLHDFYCELQKDSSFLAFYKETTNGCDIHSPISNILGDHMYMDYYLFNIPGLFEILGLKPLFLSHEKYYQIKNCNTNHRARCVLIAVLLEGIISGSNYTDKQFTSEYKKISATIHEMHITNKDLCKKMNLFDLFEKVLMKISPYVKNICTCKRSWYNYNFSKQWSNLQRLDILERIVWETKLNDFYYFVNIMQKMILINSTKKLYNYIGICKNVIPKNIGEFDDQTICKILDYFQLTISPEKYACVYNGKFVSSYKIPYLTQDEILTIDYVKMPDYCFVCGKYDVTISYTIINGKYSKQINNNPVRDFACNNCKAKIIRYQKLEQCINNDPMMELLTGVPKIEFFKIHYGTTGSDYKLYLQQRRLKPLMLIMASLFDEYSLFALFPKYIIQYIILSTYWNPFNAISDDSFYARKPNNEILYSNFRSTSMSAREA